MSGTDSNPGDNSHLDTVRKQLQACFSTSTAQSAGSFLHQDTRQSFPNPSIKIKDVGNVGLPMSPRDIDAVKQASHQAPFGKGTETIVDESVRKTWQINATDIVCFNPRWENWVTKEVLPKCCDALGVSAVAKPMVRAELYKMLLYEEGAHFQPHKDTEKAPGMFATLAICLPTEHQGGDLVLKHNNRSLTWSSSNSSVFDLSFAAWYSDVIHEVKPITSGHRVVLTYNLINIDQSIQLPAASTIGDRDGQLLDALKLWSEAGVWNDDNSKEVDFLCHCLQHQYTQSSLSLSRLAGADLSVVTKAVRAAQQTDFVVYLATFERTRSGGCNDGYGYGSHEIIEETDDDWKLQKIVALDGTAVAKDVLVSKWEMLDPEVFDDRDPDDEDFEGWTGNEGASTTQWYRSSMMILMPKKKLNSFTIKRIQQGNATVEDTARARLKIFKAEPENEKRRSDLLDFAQDVYRAMKEEDSGTPQPVPWYGDKLRSGFSGFSMEDQSVLIICFAWLGMPEMCEAVQKLMQDAMDDAFFAELSEPIQRSGGIMHYQSFLAGALSSQDNISYLLMSMDELIDPSSETGRDPEVISWSRQLIQKTLDSYDAGRLMMDSDAGVLLDLCARFGPSFYFESVLPCAIKHIGQAWFSVRLACELTQASTEECGIDASQLSKDSSRIVKALIDNEADVQVVRLKESQPESRFGYPYFGSSYLLDSRGKKKVVERVVSGAVVVQLYIAMTNTNAESPSVRDSFLSMVVHRLLDAAKQTPSLLPDQLVPIARLLAVTHPITQAESSQTIRTLATEIWASYLRDVVQACPSRPNLIMSPLRDSSIEAQEVNRFLANPTQSRYEFRAAEKKRRHMESAIRRTHGEGASFNTLSTGRPYALVITKRPEIPYNKKLKEWNERASQARIALSKCPQLLEEKVLDPSFFAVLPEASMREILRDFIGPSAVLQYPVTKQAPQPTNAALTPITGNASSAVPAKRKASDEIVDLTGA